MNTRRPPLTAGLILAAVLAVGMVLALGAGGQADTLLGATITIGTTSTEVDVKVLTGRMPASYTGWLFENNDAADNIECQFDPAAPAPVIGIKNQMRIKADSAKTLGAFVVHQKFRCIAAGDGASLRFETVGH